ncbi:MAG: glycosyltransferase family 9 protein [Candidatus Omnitrophota bacterium]
MKEKILITKIGYTEFLVAKTDDTVSLGDVLRCTPILHCLKDAQVTWLTDKSCYPLLSGIPYISRLMHYDLTTVLQLQSEYFDTVINLEKAPGICALSDSIKAWKKYGFRFNPITGEVAAYLNAEKVLEVSADQGLKHESRKTSSDFLFEIIGKRWQGEGYLLGYTPKTAVQYDIGFNTQVGVKWPTKAWPQEYWKTLEDKLSGRYSITHQQGLDSLYEYMDWVNSCRCLVTNDSLGLHLALAMNKKVVAMFGPSFANEVNVSSDAVKLLPEVDYECIPCMSQACTKEIPCMKFISPDRVEKEVDALMRK